MTKALCSLALALLLCCAAAGSAIAGPLEDGEAAFERGDDASAQRILQPLAEAGNTTAQLYLGTIYVADVGGTPEDSQRGAAWLTKAANSGSALAQYALGRLYLDGVVATRDPRLAASWFLKAAEQDGAEESADAQLELGRMYEGGFGVPRDDAEARRWFAKARAGLQANAKRGDLRSQLTLASMYENGIGGARDADEASALFQQVASAYRKSADRGDSRAQVGLARMYENGQGLAKSRVQAAIWFRRAADQGDTEAQLELSFLYQSAGPFLAPPFPDDAIQAYIWFSLAATGPQSRWATTATGFRDDAAKTLSAAQLAEADRFVRAWRPVKETPGPSGAPAQMTPAQWAESERIRPEWEPTPAEIAASRHSAEAYDVVLGSKTAKLRAIEYVSLNSWMAARFQEEVFPQLKAQYIDKGTIQFVFRDLETPPMGPAYDAALLAHCDGGKRYVDVLSAVFHNLDAIQGRDRKSGLRNAAHSVGFSDEQFDKCVSDQAERDALAQRGRTFTTYHHILGAPTFVIGDQVWVGFQSLARMQVAIGRALGDPIQPAGGWGGHDPRFLHGLFMRAVDRDAGDDPAEPPPKPGDERFPQVAAGDVWLRSGAIITGDMIAEATLGVDDRGRTSISFRMTDEGRRRFAEFSTANIGNRFAIVWNGVVIETPSIAEPITGGGGQITGVSAGTAQEIVGAFAQPKEPSPTAN